MDKLCTGQIFECEVSDFGMNGEGIVKIGGRTVFVPYAIKGERIKIKINYSKAEIAFADLIEVLYPSNDRVKPMCPYFTRCGGCDLQHIKYDAQLEIKRVGVERVLKKVAGIERSVPTPVFSSQIKYRNKLSLPFGVTPSGITALGFYEKKTHKIVPMKICPLHGEWAANLISAVTAWANGCGISVYNEKTKKGLLRHIVARMLDTLSLTIVINGKNLPQQENLIEKLNAYFSDFAVYVSSNTSGGNVILGDTVKLIYGKPQTVKLGAPDGRIHVGENKIIGCDAKKGNGKTVTAELSPLSFLQVNDCVRDKLYSAVCDELAASDGDILELYAGIGLLTAEIAARLERTSITAVEIVPSATENAAELMRDCGFEKRVSNVTADAAEFINTADGLDAKFKAVILDPPRKGCDATVINALTSANIPQIVYISCNPPTLARDIKALLAAGYAVKTIQPFDMFPQTSHIETLVCLTR